MKMYSSTATTIQLQTLLPSSHAYNSQQELGDWAGNFVNLGD